MKGCDSLISQQLRRGTQPKRVRRVEGDWWGGGGGGGGGEGEEGGGEGEEGRGGGEGRGGIKESKKRGEEQ